MGLPSEWAVPPAISERVGATTIGRQRALTTDGHLVLILHAPPNANEHARRGVFFWRDPTGRWSASTSAGGAALQGLPQHLAAFARIEDDLTDQYERADSVADLFQLLERLAPLSRAARNLYIALQSARDAIANAPELVTFRDLAYEIDRDFELLTADTRNALQYRIAKQAEEQNALASEALIASQRLNSLAAWFFPITAIASVMGMNLLHPLNQRSTLAFWAVFAIGTALGFALRHWVMGRNRRSLPQTG
ncbi:MAG: hypothetical protein IPL79_03960 [Myxococcales bacterium]|nr:hypothetical protein [Myxococcales bacterium]